MISDRTRQELWSELLDISRMCRYYEALQSRYTRWHVGLRFTTLVAIAVGIGGVLELLPGPAGFISGVTAFGIALLTIWESVANYSKKAAVAHAIHFRCSQLEVDIRELWMSVDDDLPLEGENEIRRDLRHLARMAKEVENWAGFSDIHTDYKLNEKTTRDAYDVAVKRHSTKVGDGGNDRGTAEAKPTS